MKTYIIGGGATASVVKLFYPMAKIIAPAGKSFLPIHYIWETEETLKFMGDFKISFIKEKLSIYKGSKPEEIEYYNKITHKPISNRPSEGKKEIAVLSCALPKCSIDICESVVGWNEDKIFTTANVYEYDIIFVCSPLLFENIKAKYYPIRIYKCKSPTYCASWKYAYLWGKLLKNNIYRLSAEDGCLFLEQAGDYEYPKDRIEDWVCETMGINIKVITSYVNKFAHFDKPKQINQDTKKIIFASRLSTLDHEFLLSDLIKKMYKVKQDGIC